MLIKFVEEKMQATVHKNSADVGSINDLLALKMQKKSLDTKKANPIRRSNICKITIFPLAITSLLQVVHLRKTGNGQPK